VNEEYFPAFDPANVSLKGQKINQATNSDAQGFRPNNAVSGNLPINQKTTNDADGFNPTKTSDVDPVSGPLNSIIQLLPGKEYDITVSGQLNGDMIYAGYSNGVHLFNGEDKAHYLEFTEEEISSIIKNKGVCQVLESKKNYSGLNEGTLAKRGAKNLSDINLADSIENMDDEDWVELYKAISDALGEDPMNVIQVDSETNDEDPLQSKIYNYLSTNLNAKVNIETNQFKNSNGWSCMLDPKLKVVRVDDFGFVGFFFTANSNF
jgi:hypothetical protein